MNYAMRHDFIVIFILIYLYLILRILVNTKHKQANVVKELFLTGFIVSIIYILAFTILSIYDNSSMINENNFVPFKSIYNLFIDTNILSTIYSIFVGMILFVPIGFFVYPSIEYNFKDAMMICLLFSIGISITHLVNPYKIINIDDFILNILGSFLGILLSYNLSQKISA